MSKFARGTFLMTIAHLFFMGSGYLVQVLLGRYFLPSVYGTFGVIVNLLSILSTLAVSGIYQSVAKFVAATPKASRAIFQFALKLEFVIALIFTMALFFLAEPMAIIFLKDPGFIFPLKVIAFILPFYIFRSVFFGLLLGLEQYLQLSLTNIFSGIVKIALVIVTIFLGHELIGVLLVYLVTAAVNLFLGIWFVYKQKLGRRLLSFDQRQFLGWSLLLTALAFITPLFQNMNLFLLKYLEVPPEKVGFFNAAITFGSLPSILSVGLVGALLPAVSSTYAQKKLESLKDQISDALRYSLLFLLPLVTILSITSKSVIPMVFSQKYSEASASFSILLFGSLFFALYNVLNSVLIAVGKGREILFCSGMFVLVNLMLNLALIPSYGINGAAVASSVSFFLAFLVFLLIISLEMGAFWLKSWLFKIPLASFTVGFFSYKILRLIPSGNLLGLLSFYALLVGIYFGLLLFLKEVSKKDIELIKSILSFEYVGKLTQDETTR
jgi:stage V sporulation protein B